MNDQLRLPKIDVNVKCVRQEIENYPLEYATAASAGVDLRACIVEKMVTLEPGHRFAFPTGVAIEILKPGVAGFIYSRSGLGTKKGLVVSQGVGVIDPDYRGEIIVSLLNNSPKKQSVEQYQRIAQLTFQPVFQARFIPQTELGATARGNGGFGHTGKH